ncbi:TonB-dependent receptor plug domain-containing protein [Janthinobacterium psychrotolerans]|uniref:TonB-dependent receptor plug domain-containing protein n=1 Tax=Janthinobacterium psychrotolerans TaxID=1747903 RepID=UPI001FE08456|nr:TonB-dependent receptor [Janthinobacterium psychrotolerans]
MPFFRVAVCGAAILFVCNTWAQQAPQDGPRPAENTPQAEPVQQVEVKGGAYDPRRDDTASKMVVGSDEMLKYGDTTVTDVLKRLPGITVTGAAGRQGGEIRMRGLGSGYTQILLNGERAPAGFSLDSLAPELIERIEILHAASAEYSTQSIAGTINVVLKNTVKTAQREIKLGMGGGRDAFSRNGSLQWSDKDGRLSYSLSASVYRYDYDAGGLHDSPALDLAYLPDGQQNLLRLISGGGGGRSEGVNLAPRLNWNSAGGDSFTAQFFLNAGRSNSHSNYHTETLLGARPDVDNDDSRNRTRQRFGRADLGWVHKLDGGAKLELGLRGMVSNSSTGSATLGDIDGLGLALDRKVEVGATYKTLSSSGKFYSPWMPGHALSTGWDGTVSRREEERHERQRAVAGGDVPLASDDNFAAHVNLLALYAQDEWDITPRWSMYAGLRWEGIATRTSGNRFEDVGQRSSVWSPLLQTLWKLPDTKGDQLRLALTRTYKAPSTSSLVPRRSISTNNSQFEPDRQGNPQLKPELALGVDASYDHYWAEGALLSARASARRIDGYTRQGLLWQDGRWVSTPVNDGRANTRTLGLEAKFPLRAVQGATAPAIDLRASINRNWSQVAQVPGPNNRLDQQTPVSGTVGIDYKTPGGMLTTGGSLSFTGGGPVRITPQQYAYSSPRRDLDLYALWKFNPKHQLRLAVSNLLAQDYESNSAYADAHGSMIRAGVSGTAPQARATMEMKF